MIFLCFDLKFDGFSMYSSINGGGMKSCRLGAISYQVTQKLKRAKTLE